MWEVGREIYDMLVFCLTSRGRVMPVSLMSRFLLPAYIRLISVWAETMVPPVALVAPLTTLWTPGLVCADLDKYLVLAPLGARTRV